MTSTRKVSPWLICSTMSSLLSDLSKTRVVAVEVRGVFAVVDDEELRAPSVASSVGHAEYAFVVVLVVAIEFAVNRVIGPSARCPGQPPWRQIRG